MTDATTKDETSSDTTEARTESNTAAIITPRPRGTNRLGGTTTEAEEEDSGLSQGMWDKLELKLLYKYM